MWTAEENEPTFPKNVENNPVKIEIYYLRTYFLFSKCSSEHAEISCDSAAKTYSLNTLQIPWKTENGSRSKSSSKCHSGYVECKFEKLAEVFLPQVDNFSKNRNFSSN